MKADVVFRGGEVMDGTGAAARPADVAVRDGRIVGVAPGWSGDAHREIDARGHVVAPGFIDIKTHSDFTLPLEPLARSMIRQGVTTEVVGHCGASVAPAPPGRADILREYLAAFAPWLEVPERTFREYMDTFPPTSVNTVMQAGHTALRLAAMGMAERAPTTDEMGVMARLLEEALDAGAVGLSSGLFTAPGSYAAPDELLALARVARRHGATYATHIRDEAGGLFDAVREAIAVGEATGVHVQIVHMKLSGTDNWGRAPALLAEIDAARRRGVAVDCDCYPYVAAGNPLRNLLPLWALAGSTEAMLQRLADPAARARIREEIAVRGLASFGKVASWDDVRVSTAAHRPEAAGRSIADLARAQGADPVDALCDFLIATRGMTYGLITSIAETDVQALLRCPFVFVGSDGRAVAPDNVTGQGRPHPRFYGTFPRVLGRYVREDKLLSLPEAVRKMTQGPARVLGLRDRGVLREGTCADVTVFDPRTIADRATFDDPSRYPTGIPTVMVNGVIVVDAGEHTGARPGHVLRRTAAGVV